MKKGSINKTDHKGKEIRLNIRKFYTSKTIISTIKSQTTNVENPP